MCSSDVDRVVAGAGRATVLHTAWQRPASDRVPELCGLLGRCAGSQSGSASDKLPVEVSCADGETEQRDERCVERQPVLTAEQGFVASIWE